MKEPLSAVLEALRRVRARTAQLAKGEPQVPGRLLGFRVQGSGLTLGLGCRDV